MDSMDWFVMGFMIVVALFFICKMVSSDMKEIEEMYQEYQRIKAHSKRNGIHMDKGFDTMSEYIEHLELLSQQKEQKERGVELARLDLERQKAKQFVLQQKHMSDMEALDMVMMNYNKAGARPILGETIERPFNSDTFAVDLTQPKEVTSELLILPDGNVVRLAKKCAFDLRFASYAEKAHIMKQFYYAAGNKGHFIFDDKNLVYYAEAASFYYYASYDFPRVTICYEDHTVKFIPLTSRNSILNYLQNYFPEADVENAVYDLVSHTYTLTKKVPEPQYFGSILEELVEYPLNHIEMLQLNAYASGVSRGQLNYEDNDIVSRLRNKYSPPVNDYVVGRRTTNAGQPVPAKLPKKENASMNTKNWVSVDMTEKKERVAPFLFFPNKPQAFVPAYMHPQLISHDDSIVMAQLKKIMHNPSLNLFSYYAEENAFYYDIEGVRGTVQLHLPWDNKITLPSSFSRQELVESISILYPYLDFANAWYDKDTHTYHIFKEGVEESTRIYPQASKVSEKTESEEVNSFMKKQEGFNAYDDNLATIDLTESKDPDENRQIYIDEVHHIELRPREYNRFVSEKESFKDFIAIFAISGVIKDTPWFKNPDVSKLVYYAEENMYYYDEAGTLGTVKANVNGVVVSLSSDLPRRNVYSCLQGVYPDMDYKKVYYNNKNHTYYIYNKDKRKLPNRKLFPEKTPLDINHVRAGVLNASNAKVGVLDNNNAYIPHQSSLSRELLLREEATVQKKVAARDWFLGIEETEQELNARYNKQKRNILGWDDF